MRRAAHVVALIAWLWSGIALTGGCHIIGGYDQIAFEEPPKAQAVDLLLVVDNSAGTIMADKQQVFEQAVSGLVMGLMDLSDDVHVGVVTTSLGGVGADTCTSPQENQRGRLVARRADGSLVPTHRELGYLAWDPGQAQSPPGASQRDELLGRLRDIVLGTGEVGCGFEATLEAWYRFLVEPEPYADLALDDDGEVQPIGTDELVLAQRQAFLRPDSLLLIVVLSDENDCSLIAGGRFYLAAQKGDGEGNLYHLPPARAACAIGPDHPCCVSCADPLPAGCEPTPGECDEPLSDEEDPLSLRCFQQARRFGIDFLQPLARYRAGLTEATIASAAGSVHPNPVVAGRDPRLVLYASIVGVPWQDVARRQPEGQPDARLGLQTPAEMDALGTWDVILGDPARYFDPVAPQLPTDPFMIESVVPRESAQHPLIDAAIAASPADQNPVNGYEHDRPTDLQYACIYRLGEPRDCTGTATANCHCADQPDSPLCRDPDTGELGTLQHYAPAYPGVRHLALARSLGEQALVGPVCLPQAIDPSAPQGYQPLVDGLLERAAPILSP